MKKGISQLIAIILSAMIAFIFGFGGGVAWDYAKTRNLIPALNGIVGEENQADKTIVKPGIGSGNPAPSKNQISADSNININVSEDLSIGEAVATKVLPSVVGVTTTYEYTYNYGGGFDFFFGYGFGGQAPKYEGQGVGTGVIVDPLGFIVTNAHVINDGDFTKIEISLYDGSTQEAKVLWFDKTLDLAMLKIDAVGLTAAELGDSDDLMIGSYAAAIGNPLGLAFERSMSQGIISGLGRSIKVSDSSSGTTTTMDNLIQTDATINSGNSGGPLLNSRGQVIGINSAKAASGEGMGFAIPINTLKPIVAQIKEKGTFTRAYIGITGYDLESQGTYTEEQLQEYFGTTKGIYIYSITEGGGAEAAGLKQGDIILSLDGIDVSTMNKLNQVLVNYKDGDKVELRILRDGEELTVSVTLTDGNILIAE